MELPDAAGCGISSGVVVHFFNPDRRGLGPVGVAGEELDETAPWVLPAAMVREPS